MSHDTQVEKLYVKRQQGTMIAVRCYERGGRIAAL